MKGADTTVLIDALREDPRLKRILDRLDDEGVVTTEVNVFETLFGVHFDAGPKVESRLQKAQALFEDLVVLPLERGGADRAARVAAQLAREGRMIGTGDALVAGILLDRGVDTLVTRDIEHFGRIRGLRVETY